VPFAMIGAFLASFISIIWVHPLGSYPLLYLSPPYHWLIFILQLLFYLLAWLGRRVTIKGFLGKLLYLPTFLVNSNYAALLGLLDYLTGKSTVIWKKTPRRGYNSD